MTYSPMTNWQLVRLCRDGVTTPLERELGLRLEEVMTEIQLISKDFLTEDTHGPELTKLS